MERHEHRYHQWILYLTGNGEQVCGEAVVPVGGGSWVFLPRNVAHGFRRLRPRPPLILVLDFTSSLRSGFRHGRLTDRAHGDVRSWLHALSAIRDESGESVEAEREAIAWAILAVALNAISGAPPRGGRVKVLSWRIERLLREPEAVCWSAAEVAGRMGWQRDYLNRRLKEETGRSLRQWRYAERLRRAQEALRGGQSSAAAATASGFDDPNYFSRWFRQQTGQSPSQFRRTASGIAEAGERFPEVSAG